MKLCIVVNPHNNPGQVLISTRDCQRVGDANPPENRADGSTSHFAALMTDGSSERHFHIVVEGGLRP